MESSAADLCDRVQALEKELKSCQAELHRIQRQLRCSERLHRSTEIQNQELQRQVEDLRREIFEKNKTTEEKTDQEVQTEDHSAWSHSDYYYYSSYANYYNTTNAHEVAAKEDGSGGVAGGLEQAVAEPKEHSEAVGSGHTGEHSEMAYDQNTLNEEGESLAESLRATAEAALSQTGYTYDESSGMYYDHSTGFYYDSETQLYYDSATGIYYYCDVESGRYQFHSRVDLQSFTDTNSQLTKDKKAKKKRRLPPNNTREEDKGSEEVKTSVTSSSNSTAHDRISYFEREAIACERKKAKLDSYNVDIRESSSSSEESEPEEGEITESEKASSDEDMSSGDSVTANDSEIEDVEKIWPPCIRVIVVRSPALQKGSLFIITAVKSATIGRERGMGHTIRIPELGVSKFHAEVYFDNDLQSYVLVDQGSQNGTVINGNQILQPKQKCEPCVLEHGDEVKLGETVLSFHIHPGSDTCDGCEPGQVRAHLRLDQTEESSAGPILNKEEKELLRREGLKQIRVKYGLQGADYEANKAVKNPKYKDRAGRRRQVVGSEGNFQRDDAPASVHVEINDGNKGRKMLEKMGWKKGEGLGKTSDGMRDPIQLQLRQKKAGLGSSTPSSIEEIRTVTQNKKNWEKARERYAEAFPNKQTNDAKKCISWTKESAE
ncbi:angiogenic factor with G patch and FHA domains 1 isoform X1 [Spea bombifrons]|uniref:angiogenic factor with G patch and FHA domains 1 isoform X1 n=1 Tax=Spea bombifrons TaxID=233779 RepID=UPI0023499CB1|nr:angiogenic factor with G patch and FHA domains 1 isoform X1 [Spea bombifrons]